MQLLEIRTMFERPEAALVAQLARCPTANLSDAMANLNTMTSGIHAVAEGLRCCGPACTAVTRNGDFLPVLRALHAARAGDVLVIDNQGDSDTALWGEITTTEAQGKGLAGVVVDGLVRDIEGICAKRFPVFARGQIPRVGGRASLGEVNVPVRCGGVVVHPGDIVVADSDGVVVVPREKAALVIEAAERIHAFEEDLMHRVSLGESQVDIFRLEEEYDTLYAKLQNGYRVERTT